MCIDYQSLKDLHIPGPLLSVQHLATPVGEHSVSIDGFFEVQLTRKHSSGMRTSRFCGFGGWYLWSCVNSRCSTAPTRYPLETLPQIPSPLILYPLDTLLPQGSWNPTPRLMNGLTNTWEDITFPQLLLRAVIILKHTEK